MGASTRVVTLGGFIFWSCHIFRIFFNILPKYRRNPIFSLLWHSRVPQHDNSVVCKLQELLGFGSHFTSTFGKFLNELYLARGLDALFPSVLRGTCAFLSAFEY
jgi:hypothetical protein